MTSIWQLGSLSSGDITAQIGYLGSNDPAVLGRSLLNSKYGCLWIKIHHGTYTEHAAETDQWLADFRAASQDKVLVGGWGVNEVDPVGEAYLVHQLVKQYGLAAYIADAEGPHKQDWPGGDRSRTKIFCDNFRKLRPTLPFGWSSFAAAFAPYQLGSTQSRVAGPMDYFSPFGAKARWIPQVYPNESGPVYSMGVTVEHADRASWPRNLTHPWLGCWQSDHPYDVREYIAEMKVMGLIGFNVFRIELMTQADFDILQTEIKTLGIARPRAIA